MASHAPTCTRLCGTQSSSTTPSIVDRSSGGRVGTIQGLGDDGLLRGGRRCAATGGFGLGVGMGLAVGTGVGAGGAGLDVVVGTGVASGVGTAVGLGSTGNARGVGLGDGIRSASVPSGAVVPGKARAGDGDDPSSLTADGDGKGTEAQAAIARAVDTASNRSPTRTAGPGVAEPSLIRFSIPM